MTELSRSKEDLFRMANAVRALSMDAVQAANSGHPGMPMGMADVATVLFDNFLKFDALDPEWPDRDRLILSAGHGSMLLYSLMYLTGNPDMPLNEVENFRQWDSKTAGHPEFGHARGIETTTGPLGQGLANAVGFALAERLLNARFGDGLVDHHTYVIAGDGCLMEGISHEAVSLAGHLKLGKLIVLFDDNGISIDGATDLAVSDDQRARFAASGWDTQAIDGHDPAAIAAAIAQAKTTDTPSLIACRTVIGFGAPTKEGTAATHGAPLGPDEIAGTREKLAWPYPAFEVPAELLDAWRIIGARGAVKRNEWEARHNNAPDKAAFDAALSGAAPAALTDAFKAIKHTFSADRPTLATRQSSQKVLEAILPAWPELVGGSADLTGSNGTFVKGLPIVQAPDYDGRYIHYGVREHAMAAAMNGMALHGGVVPYGATFLVFTDYCRPSIRLSALMGQRVVYVMTHDSIGLGEDGPTHQPIEHLAALRAMPNLLVLRPADAIETAEAWEIALHHATGPSVLALTRQGLPHLRDDGAAVNLSAKGAYVLADADDGAPRRVTILATGSEVVIALEAKKRLESQGLPTAVVSMPCWELFAAQPADYKAQVLAPDTLRVAIEAASPFGWERWVGEDGATVGLDRFGASAPAKDLYRKLGLTADAVVDAVNARL